MRLSTYIQRTRALGDAQVSAQAIDLIGAEIERGAQLADLLKHKSPLLPLRLILTIWRSARLLRRHQEHLSEVAKTRREQGLKMISMAVMKSTLNQQELRTLERVEVMLPPGTVAEHHRRDAIKESIALWNACAQLTMRSALAEITLQSGIGPDLAAEYGELVDKSTLDQIANHRWQAIRRGVRVGALQVQIELPTEEFVQQIGARGAELFALMQERDAQELLRDLVLVDLHEGVLALKDEEAARAAMLSASTAYLNLLTTPRPPQSQNAFAGVWLTEDELGVAIVARDGHLLTHARGPLGANPLADLEALFGGTPVDVAVLPTQAKQSEALQALLTGLQNLEVMQVEPTALQEGVQAMGDHELSGPCARAAVLARRATRPMKYWGQIDPLKLGLAAYQRDLDETLLRAMLEDMRVLAQQGVKPADLAQARPAPPRPRLSAKGLNPLIKTLDDLRPGLQVNGLVTKIVEFGAFVNIGLPNEGMVHISQFSETFVSDPNEVVRVGQQVRVRVISVDRKKRHIALSLRLEGEGGRHAEEAPHRSERGSPERRRVRLDDIPDGRGGRRSGGGFGSERLGLGAGAGKSRSQALADLERLFDKKG